MNVHALALPGAHFADAGALRDHRSAALDYETAIAAYASGGDVADLWDALASLGFDNADIQEHANRPGWRMPIGYA